MVRALIPSLIRDLDADCYEALDALAVDSMVLGAFSTASATTAVNNLLLASDAQWPPTAGGATASAASPWFDYRLRATHLCDDAAAVDASGPVALQAHLAAALGVPKKKEEGNDEDGVSCWRRWHTPSGNGGGRWPCVLLSVWLCCRAAGPTEAVRLR